MKTQFQQKELATGIMELCCNSTVHQLLAVFLKETFLSTTEHMTGTHTNVLQSYLPIKSNFDDYLIEKMCDCGSKMINLKEFALLDILWQNVDHSSFVNHKNISLHEIPHDISINGKQYFVVGFINFCVPKSLRLNNIGHFQAYILHNNIWLQLDDLKDKLVYANSNDIVSPVLLMVKKLVYILNTFFMIKNPLKMIKKYKKL